MGYGWVGTKYIYIYIERERERPLQEVSDVEPARLEAAGGLGLVLRAMEAMEGWYC